MSKFVTFLTLLSTSVFAQEAAQAAPKQNPLMSFVPFILIFGVFYFLMIRPQKKKFEEEQNFLKSIKSGDEVYTKAGLIGTISGQTDKVVTLEVADGVKMKVLKGQIAGSTKKLFAPAPQTKK